jgi:peptide/nickel transport system substrate-binding protein
VKWLLAVGVLGALALGLSGCFSGGGSVSAGGSRSDDPLRGGTLRIGNNHPFGTEPRPSSAQYALDPQFEYSAPYFELFRCCLSRTLFSYSGQPSDQGGAIPRPDLAATSPQVSEDGLVWTFQLKRGLHYAPPFQRREIVTGDIVHALEREFRLGANASYSSYYTVIEGAKAFAARKADSISGLEVPDPHTLVVHLTEPTGDLDYRFSLPASAPIPPGADRGHDGGYGRYLVSSGPYMIAGSERMNFTLPPEQQRPPSGWTYRYALRGGKVVILGRESLRLVRNPSWDPRSDRLRKAYPDRIELEMRGTPDSELKKSASKIDRGALDVMLDESAPYLQVRRYQRSPRLRTRLHANKESGVNYISMNLALPPFDDVHVRRALNLALDRTTLARIENSVGIGPVTPIEHSLPDSVEGDLLAAYSPYSLHGNPGAAREEMARSRYDRNHDGRCDILACKGIATFGVPLESWPLRGTDALVRRDFARVGVILTITQIPLAAEFPKVSRPQAHGGLFLNTGWLVDFPDGAGFAPVLETPPDLGNLDFDLLGATPQQLRRWGYATRSVPSVDGKITECRSLLGSIRTRCWAELDQLLTQRIVPWVPRSQLEFVSVTSARVARYSYDQFAPGPALDRIALKRGSR